MNNEHDVQEETQDQVAEDRLTVEIPTEIQAGRSSSDCYSCSTLAVA